jgi:hypothetical protein
VKRTLVAVALVIVFVMALAAPAFAQSITHSATYQMDGVINFKKQMGHLCNTGAEIKSTIMGSGQLDKVQTVSMEKGKITMKDANDGVAGATPLTVTTVWELCSPPKFTYDAGLEVDYVPNVVELYHGGAAGYSVPLPWNSGGHPFGTAVGSPWDIAEDYGFGAVSDQIWAVQVQADPGFSGNLHQSGEAAYGAFGGVELGSYDDWVEATDWTTKGLLKDSDTWKYFASDGVKVGPDFVGNYFSMNQHARTSMGTLKRYISISSPFSHGYLMEDMSVVGKSDVKEAFMMGNLPQGADIVGTWWDLF